MFVIKITTTGMGIVLTYDELNDYRLALSKIEVINFTVSQDIYSTIRLMRVNNNQSWIGEVYREIYRTKRL